MGGEWIFSGTTHSINHKVFKQISFNKNVVTFAENYNSAH